jgi:hypothetical protein
MAPRSADDSFVFEGSLGEKFLIVYQSWHQLLA